jgi:uncharacterized protein (DUF1800 family)
MRQRSAWLVAWLGILASSFLWAADPPPTSLTVTVGSNGTKTVTWPRPLIPALETNRFFTATNITHFVEEPPGNIAAGPAGYAFTTSNAHPHQFFWLELAQMSSNALLTANVLNRLAYGPTPDELPRVGADPQAYIDEQLAPENLSNPLDVFTTPVQVTNGTPVVPGTNWTSVTVTGVVSGATGGRSTLYVYLTGPGEAYIDDVQLRVFYTNYTYVTNYVVTNSITNEVIVTNVAGTYLGANVISNGTFDLPFANGWAKSANFAASDVVPDPLEGTNQVLRIVATAAGTGSGNAISQANVPDLTNNYRCVLSFSYLPRPNSDLARVNIRLSNNGVMGSDANPALGVATWYYVTATGRATTTPAFYLYLDGAGEVFIDDLKLVPGSVPEAGPNLLRNGDFESALSTDDWQRTADFTNTVLSTTRSHAGNGSLRLIATAAGAGSGDSVYQSSIAGVTNNGTYTLSFWYTAPTRGRLLTARLSGSLLTATVPASDPGSLKWRLDTIRSPSPDTGSFTVHDIGGARLPDLKAWFLMNAVGSPQQLLEVLTQFFENHFVTQHSKSINTFFDTYYDDGTLMDKLAADWEYREVSKWRQVLLNPNGTFHDLLRISAESPAMIVYLDSFSSRGDANNVANENYARELFELFCMGVDNGYDQLDITAMSRAWTGWSVDIVAPEHIDNPHAPQARTYGFYPGNGTTAVSNLVGVWTFNYKTNFHGTNRAPILSVWATNASRTNLIASGPKTYAPRLGPPWAGRPYQITLPRRTGTASIQDGYDVLASLATNVYTAEYLSVKLCRLFIHDQFPNPTTRTDLPEYAFYDYTNPNRSAETELVRQCIVAWMTPGPDGRLGNLRAVLRVIFGSELFRSHGGSLHKVKTPLEYCVSAIRALRSDNGNGTFTASTDGYSIGGRPDSSAYPLSRMGRMLLFNRDDPDGYPEAADPWISAGTLAERIRFVQTYLMAVSDTNKNDSITGGNKNLSDPVALLKKKLLDASDWNDAGAVADFFLGILFPGEGRANLDLYRQNAIHFLNTLNDGSPAPPNQQFASLSNTGADYDTRVRGMVALLMSTPRFQEQ